MRDKTLIIAIGKDSCFAILCHRHTITVNVNECDRKELYHEKD